MMIFIGPVEVSGVIGKTTRPKPNGGMVMDLVQQDAPDVVVGTIHLYQGEVERIVGVATRPRQINKHEPRRKW